MQMYSRLKSLIGQQGHPPIYRRIQYLDRVIHAQALTWAAVLELAFCATTCLLVGVPYRYLMLVLQARKCGPT